MTIRWSNNASTTITGAITPASTTVTLAAGTGAEFPAPTGGDYFVATFYDQATKTINEIVHCTARSGDVCTIQRAQEGTVAGSWNAGDIFANLVTAGTLASFVQSGTTPAANTTIVYTGDDTSTTPNLVICNTNPVPASLVLGMQFNIRIKNSSTGPIQVQLNGGAGLASTRQNGAPHIAGDLTATEEMIFVYNGVNFTSMVQDVAMKPPQNIFYVRPDGNDNNSGLSNTAGAAFATIYGAVAAIQTRYVSQTQITINVADGTYIGGFEVLGGYIQSWNIVGNVANPGNVIIDATSLTPPAGAPTTGYGCNSNTGAQLTLSGMTFKSHYACIASRRGGRIDVSNVNVYTPKAAPTTGMPCFYAHDSGYMKIYGTVNFFTGGVNPQILFMTDGGGHMSIAYKDDYVIQPLTVNLGGAIAFGNAVAVAQGASHMGIYPGQITFTGSVSSGAQYGCGTAGGISSPGAVDGVFPGGPGYVIPPGWTA